MKLTSLVDALIAAGGTMEQVRAVVAAAEAEEEATTAARRAKAAAKKRRQRSGMSPDVPGTDGDEEGQTGTNGDPQTPNKNIKTNTAHAREARIDPDWEPSPADVEAVTKRGLLPERLADEVQAFREWHLGAGTLSDGFGMLFRGWVRTGQRNAPKPLRSARGGQPARASPRPGPPSAEFVSVDGVRITPSMVRAAVASGQWPRSYGKPRGDRDCRIPAAWFEPEPVMDAAE